MAVYNNLKKIEFQVVKGDTIKGFSDKNVFAKFFFKDLVTSEYGVPLPDFNGEPETLAFKYHETLICDLFRKYADNYIVHDSYFITTLVSDKNLSLIVKELKKAQAVESKSLNINPDNFKVSIVEYKDRYYLDIMDTTSFSNQESIESSASYDKLKFFLSIENFEKSTGNRFIYNGSDDEFQDSIEKMKSNGYQF